MMSVLRAVIIIIALIQSVAALADSPSFNRPFVVATEDGACYAKAVPAEPLGDEGRTTVYRVEEGGDSVVQSYEWYSRKVFIFCDVDVHGTLGTIAVKFTAAHDGSKANERDATLEVYHDKDLAFAVSTLAIAGKPANVFQTFSRYFAVQSIEPEVLNGRATLKAFTNDDRILRIDLVSGSIQE